MYTLNAVTREFSLNVLQCENSRVTVYSDGRAAFTFTYKLTVYSENSQNKKQFKELLQQKKNLHSLYTFLHSVNAKLIE